MKTYTFSVAVKGCTSFEMTYTATNYATALADCARDISECSYADKVTRIVEVSQPMTLPDNAAIQPIDLAVAILEAQTGFRK